MSRARTVLCGGCRVTGIPTATASHFRTNCLSRVVHAESPLVPRTVGRFGRFRADFAVSAGGGVGMGADDVRLDVEADALARVLDADEETGARQVVETLIAAIAGPQALLVLPRTVR